ncbi:MAG: DUF1156 domain-containing protein [Desulfurococcales archaeon]|nr:DUF1156 domain-containing protein [Desulfurococcales archaeon]
MDPLIMHYFPTDEASEESQRERAVISPPLFYLHLWWARRPLAASRASIAALAIEAENPLTKHFTEEFKSHIKLVKGLPRPAYNYNPDKSWIAKHSKVQDSTLLDPFAGGGSIPFEAVRLGFGRVVAVEYNPVAYLILKATLEYPLKYGPKLVRDVERWARWLLQKVRGELKEYFPPHPQGRPTNYIWIRTYKCPNGLLVPSISNPLLSKDKQIMIKIEGYNKDGTPKLRIKPAISKEEIENARTIIRKELQCKSRVLSSKELAQQYRMEMDRWEKEGLYGHHPAILAAVKLENGKYVQPTQEMIEAYKKAEQYLQDHWDELIAEDLIPTESHRKGEADRVIRYGIDKYYKMFNARQLLVHATMVKYIRRAYEEMLREGYGEEYAKAVSTYLALGHGRLLDYNSAITSWHAKGLGVINHTFARHAYTFSNDFGEGDILPGNRANDLLSWVFFGNTGVVRALQRILDLLGGSSSRVEVVLGDAADPSTYTLDSMVDFVVADPPYYSNVQYAELSDFFYVWHKRSIGHLYPEAFMWEVTPKDSEIVVNKERGFDGEWFSERLMGAFRVFRELGSRRLALMYAHKSFDGLYSMFEALLASGWRPVSVWGVAAEQPKSQHIVGKAAARSMMIIGAVPQGGSGGMCLWDARVQAEVAEAVRDSIGEVLGLGLGIVDALMMGIGAAFKVAGQCWPRRRPDGRLVTARDVVYTASSIAGREVARILLKAEIDPVSTMYLLARSVYGEPSYDQVRQLGYAFSYNHDTFLELFAKPSRQKNGEKVYPLKALTELRVARPSSLVEALALAAQAVLRGDIAGSIELLDRHGYPLDSTMCRYIEVLMRESGGDEKRALQALYSSCIRGVGPRDRGQRKVVTLEEYMEPSEERGGGE